MIKSPETEQASTELITNQINNEQSPTEVTPVPRKLDKQELGFAIDNMITMLRKGLQQPFVLYTDEVMQKLMKDIPPLESTPEWAVLQTIPNTGKIYSGEDLQMIELLKIKRELDLDSIIDWCAGWSDLVIRTQYKQAWCVGEISKCVRLFRDQQLSAETVPNQLRVCVTFDSLCGSAFVCKNSDSDDLRQLLRDNFLGMVDHIIKISETFIEQIRKECATKQEQETSK